MSSFEFSRLVIAASWMFSSLVAAQPIPIGTVSRIDSGPPPALAGPPIGVDDKPLGIAVTPDGTRAYVVTNEHGTIQVIGTDPLDPATYNMVIANIFAGGKLEWVVIRADGARAYVTDECVDRLFVINTDPSSEHYNTVEARVSVGINPEKVALVGRIEDGNLRAVTADEGFGPYGSLTVVDAQPGSPTENQVLNSIPLDGAPEALTTQTTPDGLHMYLYVTLEALSAVQVVDPTDFSFVTRITVGTYPEGIAVHPDPARQRVYATNALGNSVSVIDTSSNTVVAEIGVGENPQGIAFSPDGEVAYVANMDSGTISIIDTSQETVVNTVDARELPYGIAFTPDGSNAYVTNSLSNDITLCNR